MTNEIDTFCFGPFKTIHQFKGGVRLLLDMNLEWAFQYNKPYWVRIVEDSVCLDIYLLFKENSNLIVSGQDSLISGRRDLPYFYRAKWTNRLSSSFMTFSDPSLYVSSEFGAGYFSQKNSWLLLNKAIKKIAVTMNLKDEDILFYGASAGGYWALTMATEYPTSKFIIDIPQIDLDSYFRGAEKEKFASVFNLQGKLPSVFDYWKIDTIPNNVVYLNNSKDFFHIRTQYSFFLRRISEMAEQNSRTIKSCRFYFYENPDGYRGHSPLPEEKTIALLNHAISSKKYACDNFI